MLLELIAPYVFILATQTEGTPPFSPPPAIAKSLAPSADGAMSQWLVDLARHHGHLIGRADPRSASLHVMAILEAAAEISPNCADAHYWLYDLRHRMGQVDPAKASLAEYVRLTPGDDSARDRLLELELSSRQTAEARQDFLQTELKRPGLSAIYESTVRTKLARQFYERRNHEAAGKEIENALRLNPLNVEARRIAYDMFGETEPVLQRVEMALQLISINPTQASLVWELAEFLDQLSLHKQAQEWYNRAIDLHKSTDAGPIPAEYWHRLALSYASSGDFAKCKDAASTALEADPNCHVARLLRATAESRLGDAKAAAQDLDQVQRAYEARAEEVIQKKLRDEAAQLAWFYCYHRPDKKKALEFSQIAIEDSTPSSLAKLAHGYALSAHGQLDEAKKVLQPLATTDPLAALELAKILTARSEKAMAITVLHKAATIQHSGIGYELVRDALARFGEKAAEPPIHTKIVSTLEKFQRDIFNFHKRPGDFLKFTIRLAQQPVPAIGPIAIVFRLENAASFPITFGEGFMQRPLVAVSAKIGGKEPVIYKDYLQELVNARPILQPGEAIEKTRTIDVGQFRENLIRTAVTGEGIEVTAMLDPVQKHSELAPGFGTIIAAPLAIGRAPLEPTAAAMDPIFKSMESDAAARSHAAEQIGALLVYADRNRTKVAMNQFPIEKLRAALAELLRDSDWHVRAHALVAAGWSPMDDVTMKAAAPAVQDAHPVGKLLAIQLFAPHHGEKFKPVLEKLSKSDPSRYVRMMALSYLPESPRTQANTINSPETTDAPN